MRIATPYRLWLPAVAMVLAIGLPVGAQTAKKDAIGLFTAVAGKVMVVHVGQLAAVSAKLREDVYFKDVIETQAASRAKALFQDDSILTVGENSRVEVSEHVYDPANNQRSTVLKLTQGKARALVGKLFAGAGSKFEIHTTTAVAAARGTYFVVWIEGTPGKQVGDAGSVRPVFLQGIDVAQVPQGATGVANIGNTGTVGFTSGGQTVNVGPGTFSIGLPGGPPTPPAGITTGAPSGVTGAISGTELSDSPKQEKPGQSAGLAGQSPGAPVGAPSGSTAGPPTGGPPTIPGGSTPPSVTSGSGAGAVTGTPGGSTVPGFTPPPPVMVEGG